MAKKKKHVRPADSGWASRAKLTAEESLKRMEDFDKRRDQFIGRVRANEAGMTSSGGDSLVNQQHAQGTPSLYEHDETAWLEQTASLAAQRRFAEIDHEHLSEYLADMARRDRREVLSRLVVLLVHLLKWEHQPQQRTKSWEATILHQREELQDLLESGTLRNHARDVLAKAYQRAVRQAALEMGIEQSALPAACPWTVEEFTPEE